MDILIVAKEKFEDKNFQITVPLQQIQDMDNSVNFRLHDIYEILLAQMENLKEGKYQ